MHDRPRGPTHTERHAKPGGGERRLTRLAPHDDATYRRLLAPWVPAIERSLGPGVYANRAVRGARVGPWAPARRAWRIAALSAFATAEASVVMSDVRDCYGSMGERAMRALAIPEELGAFLRALRDEGVRGLPVGPDPSAILANGILAIADRAAAAEAGGHPIRWVDDVVLVAAGRRSATRAFDAWRRALEDLGLEANDAKTRWLDGRGAARVVSTGPGSTPSGPRHGIIAAP